MFLRPEITAGESKARFDSRMSEIQTLSQSYDIRLFEDRPWDDMRYMRRISGKFSKGKLDIALENESGGEQYTLKMKIIPGETPEQSLPDAQTIQMACLIFSVMSGGEFSPEFLEKKLSTPIEDARKQLSPFEPWLESGDIYSKDLPFGGHFANSVTFRINQNAEGTYTSYIKFVSYYPE
ncbi:hypothetical protein SDC9_149051 [bioreactor metagenome]|uniref:Uncharacterized protein n=1 Tax=bioreactor metagenome TaxID=1076179 RepID=A0A645EL40_9ZZZZ